MKNKDTIQYIGLDIGRGYTKAFSIFGEQEHSAIFKSLVGAGRDIDFSKHKDAIYIELDEDEAYFVGKIAEEEEKPSINSSDNKTGEVQQILLAAALSEVAVTTRVGIMLGVPYRAFNTQTLKDVQDTYKGKTISVTNKLTKETKTITIEDISIFKESDSALYNVIMNTPEGTNTKPCAMVSVGFRSTEIAYFDKGFKFIDRKSDTIEYGNRDILEKVADKLKKKKVLKPLYLIDSSEDYEGLKVKEYKRASSHILETIDAQFDNQSEMDIYVCGGTSKYMDFSKAPNIKEIEDCQMATAKGLYLLSKNL